MIPEQRLFKLTLWLNEHRRAALLIGTLVVLNIALWLLALIFLKPWPILLASCSIAYTLGLRHAMDADHIATIDNGSRQVMSERQNAALSLVEGGEQTAIVKPPISVGFFFSLGHSVVVLITCSVVILTMQSIQQVLGSTGEKIAFASGLLSVGILLMLGLANATMAVSILSFMNRLKNLLKQTKDEEVAFGDGVDVSQTRLSSGRQYRSLSDTETACEGSERILNDSLEVASWRQAELQNLLETQNKSVGCLSRLLRPFLRFVNQSWKMFFVGFVFGTGLDTSIEMSLLSISAMQEYTGQHSPTQQATQVAFNPLLVLFLPLLFTIGMCLIDTFDGIMMSEMYWWASASQPLRKLYFNLVITLSSALIGLTVGLIQLLSVIADYQQEWHSAFWDFWRDHVSTWSEFIGIAIFILFGMGWFTAWLLYRFFRMDQVSRFVRQR